MAVRNETTLSQSDEETIANEIEQQEATQVNEFQLVEGSKDYYHPLNSPGEDTLESI